MCLLYNNILQISLLTIGSLCVVALSFDNTNTFNDKLLLPALVRHPEPVSLKMLHNHCLLIIEMP